MIDEMYPACRIIDGFEIAFVGASRRGFESSLYKFRDYYVSPKDGIESFCKQDLVDHPEKFQPFTYTPCSSFGYTYLELHEYIEYEDGKWVEGNSVMTMQSEKIAKDVAYMEQYYPEQYKELLRENGLPETYSQLQFTEGYGSYIDMSGAKPDAGKSANPESQDKPEESKKAEEINYTHIPETPDLEL